jgi:hypothetical protein
MALTIGLIALTELGDLVVWGNNQALAEWTGIIHSVGCYVPRMCRPPLLLEASADMLII